MYFLASIVAIQQYLQDLPLMPVVLRFMIQFPTTSDTDSEDQHDI